MATAVLLTSLLAISSTVWSAQIPCTDESCTNLNIFLGPKWGSKVLRIPNNVNARGPSEGEVVKYVTGSPIAADNDAKPTDWAPKPGDETKAQLSEKDWVVEANESGDVDDSDWTDDSSGEFHAKVLQPTDMPLEKIDELNRKIIDWAADSSINKLNAKVVEPTGRPTDWVARTERTDPNMPQTTDVTEVQGFTKKDAWTEGSRIIMPKQRPVLEEDSFELDYSNDYQTDFRFDNDGSTKTSSNTWISVDNLNELFYKDALNLTGLGFSSEQVKQTLAGLSIATRTELRRLSLSHNQLRSLAAFTFPVQLEYGLIELRLDNNPLGVLDSFTRFELSRLGNLKVLSLAHTGLQYLESLYIPYLETLDLSGNQLVSLPWRLDGFRGLQQLDLSSNRISTLEAPPPTAYESLRALNLSDNGLKFIWNRPFERMISLDVLYLNNNNLRYTMQIADIPDTVTLYLAGNPWECSCPLVRYVHEPRSWPYVADKDALLCTDQNIRIPWPVRSLREQDVTVDCPRRWDWLRLPVRRVDRWFNSHGWNMSRLLSVLWWALLIVVIVVVWRASRRFQNTTPPYSILDDKQVI